MIVVTSAALILAALGFAYRLLRGPRLADRIIGFDGMDDAEAIPLIVELLEWQGREEFRYSHEWEPDMLVMWDNRSVLHRATGGYDGHDRLLHRTTIAAWDG